MFSLKLLKIFAAFVLFFVTSCNFWQSPKNQNANLSSALITEESKPTIPFATKEPDVYQAEIVLTSYANGEKSERKIFTARRGVKLRYDYGNGISFLQTSDNERFSIDNNQKIYAEHSTNSSVPDETKDTIKDFLTNEWLNEKRGAKFESIGKENNLTKYRVSLDDAPNKDNSEIFIYVDENLKLPVKQEFFATSGEQKNLVFSMELQNFKLETEDKLFELPKDFRKISLSEFQKIVLQDKLKQ